MTDIEQHISIMVVDDEPVTLATVSAALNRTGYKAQVFKNGAACLKEFKDRPSDIVITDIRMPEMNGLDLLANIKKIRPETEVIMMSGEGEKIDVMRALKSGAFDFLEKPFELGEIVPTIRKTVRYQTAIREHELLEQQMQAMTDREAQHWAVGNMVGKTRVMREVLKSIRQLQSVKKTSVLITGESGTGKELVARAIHFGSDRNRSEFVAVNCSAIPENLAESLLFGHKKGAFTGAESDRVGYFEEADGGTIFLDEVGDMPLTTQAKLLRVLEEGYITPVGSNTRKYIDVRILAATNSDLQKGVSKKKFREDLYYRLSAFPIHLPPLRERKSDIPHMVDHFMKKLSSEMGQPAPTITTEAMAMLKDYIYPGNIREMRNIIERALIESRTGCIQPEHLHFCSISGQNGISDGVVNGDLPINLSEATSILVKRAMDQSKGNVSAAARLLGINRSKLHRMLHLID